MLPRKARKGLPRVSKKRAALMKDVGPDRREFKEFVGACMVCRRKLPPEELEPDEIARGYAREDCLTEWTLIVVCCTKCHRLRQNDPPAKKLSCVFRFWIEYACLTYNELRGTAPTHLTADDVVGRLVFRNLPKVKK
jgi:hypothetical protein